MLIDISMWINDSVSNITENIFSKRSEQVVRLPIRDLYFHMQLHFTDVVAAQECFVTHGMFNSADTKV